MKLEQVKTLFRKYAAAFLTAGLLCLAGPSFAAAGASTQALFVVGQSSYTANGQAQSMDATTFEQNNRTYVPVRYLALALGVPEGNIGWDNATANVVLNKGNTTVRLVIGSRTMRVNEQTRTMDVAPVTKNGRTYLPARFVAEAFGYQVGWDEATGTVTVFMPDTVPSGDRVMVNGNLVNVRSGPGTDYNVVTQVNQGDVLSVLAKSNGWYQVQLPGGKNGWIVSWLVTGAPGGTNPAPGGENPGPGNGGQPGSGSGQNGGQPGNGSGNSGQPSPPGQPGNNSGGDVNAANALTSLKAAQEGDTTRVIVSAGVAMSAHAFRLTNPERLVVDLTGVQPGSQPAELNVSSATVKDVRVGYFSKNPDVTRLVFDLNQYASYQVTPSADQKTVTISLSVLQGVLSGTSIAVDAGHGGSEPGAVGPGGLDEKNVNLAVARRVAELLGQEGAQVVMTRSNDSYVGLDERTQIANQAGVDLFVSIHMNASTNSSYNGTATYYLSQRGVDAAVSYGLGSSEMETQRRQVSSQLASCIQSELVKSLGLKNDGIKDANFAVLRTSLMPAVLVEVAFISNPWQESQMTTDQFVENAANGIVRGIADFLALHPLHR